MNAVLATLDNGVTITVTCASGVGLAIKTTSGKETINLFGTLVEGPKQELIERFNVDGVTAGSTGNVDFDGIGRDEKVGRFAHIVVAGHIGNPGEPCGFWAMIIPSS